MFPRDEAAESLADTFNLPDTRRAAAGLALALVALHHIDQGIGL